MRNIELVTAWEISRKGGTRIFVHAHEYYELVYYCSGDGMSTVEKDGCKIASNVCAVIPPHKQHEEYHLKDSRVFCIGFYCDAPLCAGVYKDVHGELYATVRSIVAEIRDQLPSYKEMVSLKLQELVLQLLRLQEAPSKPGMKNFEYAVSYIAQNFHEKIILQDVAKQLHLSYDYFQHRFKELMGESPQQFLIRKRLEAAERMLMEENISITEIAQRCGFSNSAQFSAMFKQSRKKTPREVKKKVENLS